MVRATSCRRPTVAEDVHAAWRVARRARSPFALRGLLPGLGPAPRAPRRAATPPCTGGCSPHLDDATSRVRAWREGPPRQGSSTSRRRSRACCGTCGSRSTSGAVDEAEVLEATGLGAGRAARGRLGPMSPPRRCRDPRAGRTPVRRDPDRRGARVRRRPAARVRRASRRAARRRAPNARARLDEGSARRSSEATRSVRGSDVDGRTGAARPAGPPSRDHRPTDRKMVINALNSGARCFMADLEDANAPTWSNMVERPGEHRRRRSAARSSSAARTGASTGSSTRPATLLVRPRGWHLPERHLLVDGAPVSGSLFDFGLAFVPQRRASSSSAAPGRTSTSRSSRATSRRGCGTTSSSGRRTGSAVARGTIRATVADRDDPGRVRDGRDPLRAARALGRPERRALGLHLQRDQEVPAPPGLRPARPRADDDDRPVHARLHRAAGADVPPARARTRWAGWRRTSPAGATPSRTRSRSRRWREDKEREAGAGFDGTWVAHPDLVETATAEFDRVLGDRPNQLDRQRTTWTSRRSSSSMSASPAARSPRQGFATNVNVGLRYLASWLSGVGAAAIDNLMEDAATAEISRSQLWQWVEHGAELSSGERVTADVARSTIETEIASLRENSVTSPTPNCASTRPARSSRRSRSRRGSWSS